MMPTARLRRQVAHTRAIAADGGMAHAAALGLDVELWVGDFDSASASLQADHAGVRRETYPADKDKTDGELAIAAAIARGANELLLVGGLGGQTDHAVGHLGQMLALAARGIAAMASSGTEEAYPLLPGRLALDLPVGSRLSIIALCELTGLDIAGVRWPLAGATVPLGSTRTQSNLATGQVVIGLKHGTGVVVAYPV